MTTYKCSKHGDQGGFVGISVTLRGGDGFKLPQSLDVRSDRRYCMACWIDHMDAYLLPLEEVKK